MRPGNVATWATSVRFTGVAERAHPLRDNRADLRAHAVAAAVLGAIERFVGLAQEQVGGGAVVGKGGDADADGRAHHHAVLLEAVAGDEGAARLFHLLAGGLGETGKAGRE